MHLQGLADLGPGASPAGVATRDLVHPISPSLFGCNFVSFWTPSGASWRPIGRVLEPSAGFSSHLGSLLDRFREASGRPYDVGYQNHTFWTSFWSSKSKKNLLPLCVRHGVLIFGTFWELLATILGCFWPPPLGCRPPKTAPFGVARGVRRQLCFPRTLKTNLDAF